MDQLDIHFARKSEKCERMEHCDKSLAFRLHFSPSLTYDFADPRSGVVAAAVAVTIAITVATTAAAKAAIATATGNS